MYNFYRWYPSGKIIFLAPTRTLVAQQIEACFKVMGIPQDHMAQMTGHLAPDLRVRIWNSKRLFFLTPQVVVNDLSRGICPGGNIRCVVVDEAHKANGNHAYCQVMNSLRQHTHHTRILALSATPGTDIASVKQVLKNLLISHIELRSEESPDIAPYTHLRTIEKVVVPLGQHLSFIRDSYMKVLHVYAMRLINMGVLYTRDETTLTKFQVLKAREACRAAPPPNVTAAQMRTAEATFALCLTLYHALDLLLQHGTRSFYNFLQATLDGDKGQNIARSELLRNKEFQALMLTLREQYAPSISQTTPLAASLDVPPPFANAASGHSCTNAATLAGPSSHPKMEKLLIVVKEHYEKCQAEGLDTKVIIFSQYRDSVIEITEMLTSLSPLVRPMSFLGQATSNTRTKGISQKEQEMVVKKFRAGDYNTLVSTCVGEEGLDIGEVDLIVCYDAPKSPVRLVQRMGRTGRRRQGRIVVLLTKGKEEQTYNTSQFQKRCINSLLKQTHLLRDCLFAHSPRMLPLGLEPVCQKLSMATESFQMKVANKQQRKRSNMNLFFKASVTHQSLDNEGLLTKEERTAYEQRFLVSNSERKQLMPPKMLALTSVGLWVKHTAKEKRLISLGEYQPWYSSVQTHLVFAPGAGAQQLVSLTAAIDKRLLHSSPEQLSPSYALNEFKDDIPNRIINKEGRRRLKIRKKMYESKAVRKKPFLPSVANYFYSKMRQKPESEYSSKRPKASSFDRNRSEAAVCASSINSFEHDNMDDLPEVIAVLPDATKTSDNDDMPVVDCIPGSTETSPHMSWKRYALHFEGIYDKKFDISCPTQLPANVLSPEKHVGDFVAKIRDLLEGHLLQRKSSDIKQKETLSFFTLQNNSFDIIEDLVRRKCMTFPKEKCDLKGHNFTTIHKVCRSIELNAPTVSCSTPIMLKSKFLNSVSPVIRARNGPSCLQLNISSIKKHCSTNLLSPKDLEKNVPFKPLSAKQLFQDDQNINVLGLFPENVTEITMSCDLNNPLIDKLQSDKLKQNDFPNGRLKLCKSAALSSAHACKLLNDNSVFAPANMQESNAVLKSALIDSIPNCASTSKSENALQNVNVPGGVLVNNKDMEGTEKPASQVSLKFSFDLNLDHLFQNCEVDDSRLKNENGDDHILASRNKKKVDYANNSKDGTLDNLKDSDLNVNKLEQELGNSELRFHIKNHCHESIPNIDGEVQEIHIKTHHSLLSITQALGIVNNSQNTQNPVQSGRTLTFNDPVLSRHLVDINSSKDGDFEPLKLCEEKRTTLLPEVMNVSCINKKAARLSDFDKSKDMFADDDILNSSNESFPSTNKNVLNGSISLNGESSAPRNKILPTSAVHNAQSSPESLYPVQKRMLTVPRRSCDSVIKLDERPSLIAPKTVIAIDNRTKESTNAKHCNHVTSLTTEGKKDDLLTNDSFNAKKLKSAQYDALCKESIIPFRRRNSHTISFDLINPLDFFYEEVHCNSDAFLNDEQSGHLTLTHSQELSSVKEKSQIRKSDNDDKSSENVDSVSYMSAVVTNFQNSFSRVSHEVTTKSCNEDASKIELLNESSPLLIKRKKFKVNFGLDCSNSDEDVKKEGFSKNLKSKEKRFLNKAGRCLLLTEAEVSLEGGPVSSDECEDDKLDVYEQSFIDDQHDASCVENMRGVYLRSVRSPQRSAAVPMRSFLPREDVCSQMADYDLDSEYGDSDDSFVVADDCVEFQTQRHCFEDTLLEAGPSNKPVRSTKGARKKRKRIVLVDSSSDDCTNSTSPVMRRKRLRVDSSDFDDLIENRASKACTIVFNVSDCANDTKILRTSDGNVNPKESACDRLPDSEQRQNKNTPAHFTDEKDILLHTDKVNQCEKSVSEISATTSSNAKATPDHETTPHGPKVGNENMLLNDNRKRKSSIAVVTPFLRRDTAVAIRVQNPYPFVDQHMKTQSTSCAAPASPNDLQNISSAVNKSHLIVLAASNEVSGGGGLIATTLRQTHKTFVHVCSLNHGADYVISTRMAVARLLYSTWSSSAYKNKLVARIQALSSRYERLVIIVQGLNKGAIPVPQRSRYVDTITCAMVQLPHLKLLYCTSPTECAAFLHRLAVQEQARGHAIGVPSFLIPKLMPRVEFFSNFLGVNYATALCLSYRFATVAEVINSSVEELQKRAQMRMADAELLHSCFSYIFRASS